MNIQLYKSILNTFETDEVMNFCVRAMKLAPEYTDFIPASSSGKYHSPTQVCEGGQVRHVLLACTILNYILELDYIKRFTTAKKRDMMRTAMLLHDSFKSGEYNSGNTVHEHPLLAANHVLGLNGLSSNNKKYIAKLIASHSGQWTNSKYSDITLPKLVTPSQFIIHLCDYLASRKNLDFTLDINKA